MKRPHAPLQHVEILRKYHHCQGFMYSVPVLVNGDTSNEPLKSKLVFYEDGQPLRRAHEQHSTITGTGRGAYSHWEREVFFSASDNSDPNSNGRSYSYAIDHLGQHEPQDDGRIALHPPYYLQGGRSWGVAVLDEGDDMSSGNVSRLRLFEDDRPLGPSHGQHADIMEHGAGVFSHWKHYLYFSTSDGSDPNTNGRLYSYEIGDD